MRVLGLMSGTSMDGVDAALIETDGRDFVEPLASRFRPYSDGERNILADVQGCWQGDGRLGAAREVVESAHMEVIRHFEDAELIGFHGQTLAHDPDGGRTHQLGDGAWLAKVSGIPIAWDFRSADVKAGGQGAPLAPFFHHAVVRASGRDGPTAILNLGGVGNLTVVDPRMEEPQDDGALLAFDTGPANALVDDLMLTRTGRRYDEDGKAAAAGKVIADSFASALADPFFLASPPKSLDRGAFDGLGQAVGNLSTEDAAATLTAFSVACVVAARDLLDDPPHQWFVSGGGRRNPTMMALLRDQLGCDVQPIEDLGFDGDMLEAQAFAWLAVRVRSGLPISGPNTTGAPEPMTGGRVDLP